MVNGIRYVQWRVLCPCAEDREERNMRVKLGLALLFIGILAVGTLMLSGCSGGSPSISDEEPSTTDSTVAANDQEPGDASVSVQEDEASAEDSEPQPVAEPAEETSESGPEDEPSVEEMITQPLLVWTRDAGGLNHCDHMTILPDGSVEAVVCRTGSSQPTVYGTLTDEQLSQLTAWVAEYSTFTRREMEMSRAVRTTTLNGTGAVTPELDIKKEIAAFAAELYFGLTEPK